MKYLKYIFIIPLFFFLPSFASAFSCTVVAGGGNWNAAATWTSCNSTFPQAGDDVIFDATSGNVVVNVATNNLKSLTMTGYTGTLSSTNTITVVGATASTNNVILDGTITWTGTLTISPTTSTADINLTTNGKLLTNLTLAGSAADVVLQDNLSFTAAVANRLLIGSPLLNMNGKTISGNSVVNRIILQSDTNGTQRTITRGGGAFAYADFTDIDLEAAYDVTGITGEAGNCEGNSADFTFDASVTRYWVGGTGTWSSTSEWSASSGGSGGASVPLCHDDVVFDNGSFSGTSQTVSTDLPRLGRNIDWSGYTEAQSPGWTLDNTNLSINVYGSINMANGGTSVIGTYNQGGTLTFRGRSSYTLTTGGETIGSINVVMPGGTLTLQDALTLGTFLFNNGTFDANDFNVSTSGGLSANVSTTRTLTMGSGTWTLSPTGSIWLIGTSNLTFNAETSTILITSTSATAKTFGGAGLTYYNLTITGNNVTLTGSNNFNNLALNTAGLGISTKFTAGTTQRVYDFSTNGSVGSLAAASSTSASAAYIEKINPGNICEDYMELEYISVSPATTWYAGANSTDRGNNTQWIFTACPTESNPNTGARSGTPNEKVRGGFKVRGGLKFR